VRQLPSVPKNAISLNHRYLNVFTNSCGEPLLVGACTQNSSIKHAYQAIDRASEYWATDAAFFEPRYLEAEKAIAEVDDAVMAARLRSCLTLVSAARQSNEIQIDAMASRDAYRHNDVMQGTAVSSQRIAEWDAIIKAEDASVLKLRRETTECIAQGK
jgi:hypothetical protein